MVQQSITPPRLEDLMRVNGSKICALPKRDLKFGLSTFELRRYVHVAASRSLDHAVRVLTAIENYEKTVAKSTRRLAIVAPIIFYDGEIPTSVYDYVLHAPVRTGRYGPRSLFLLPAVANNESVFLRRDVLFEEWGIPQRVKATISMNDVLSARDALSQEHQTLTNISVPEERVKSQAPNVVKYLLTGMWLTVGTVSLFGAIVGAPYAPASAIGLGTIGALLLLTTKPLYRSKQWVVD